METRGAAPNRGNRRSAHLSFREDGVTYSESKLYVTTLAYAVARRWPDVLSNAVDPGWVPTKMGGPGAPDDFEMRFFTQTWLAVSDDPAAIVCGRYWASSSTAGCGQGRV
jgi:NAD(P)-dependent dehydrogenase (short-subunit alcohol dehydrogenase family)